MLYRVRVCYEIKKLFIIRLEVLLDFDLFENKEERTMDYSTKISQTIKTLKESEARDFMNKYLKRLLKREEFIKSKFSDIIRGTLPHYNFKKYFEDEANYFLNIAEHYLSIPSDLSVPIEVVSNVRILFKDSTERTINV